MKKLKKGESLTPDEIQQLDTAFIELFALHHELRLKTPISSYIKFPSVPSVLSESMVLLAARKLFTLDDSWEVSRGGKACDVLLKKGKLEMLVEVKATGKNETLEIKERDIKSNWLVWINFGTRFDNRGAGSIDIYALRSPYKHLDTEDLTNRITKLTLFLGKVGKTNDLSKFHFNSLKDFLDFCV